MLEDQNSRLINHLLEADFLTPPMPSHRSSWRSASSPRVSAIGGRVRELSAATINDDTGAVSSSGRIVPALTALRDKPRVVVVHAANVPATMAPTSASREAP